ncbi:protein FAR-RED IMPAIRED RESPONSE 1-like [Vigna angularis]|uniref:protein FAR-RED IMPAIRED RESPONSE 1-like n=1 Tax=Phaseolus angularis TaxID=3914 RepID=UPI000809C746|nr:protein FAR-RED IMPAIRED RESPONSE 1-like [Vigna angularis]
MVVMANNTSNVPEVSQFNANIDDPNDNLFDLEPTLHMCFQKMEEAKKFYTNYATRCGFAVRTRTSKKDNNNNVYCLRLVCSRERKYVSFIKPEKSMQAKHTLEVNDDAGVRINKSFLSIVTDASGFENMDFVERDARNYIGQHRISLCKDGDGQALLRHFSSMKDLNNEFFYDIALDEGNKFCSVFWADARSRAACEEFGDVVSFDTTYLTNKYDMTFAPFVGVNHYGHSILLGCGLLSSEETASFVWLFQSWLRCMGNKAPDGIITDQCKGL